MTRHASPSVRITALGHFHPEHELGNDFFGRLEIDSDATWIEERTGIVSRRSVLSPADVKALRYGHTTLASLREEGRVMPIGNMAREAWQMLMPRRQGGIQATDLDAVLCGTSIPDFDIPANACAVAAAIGAHCPAFDTNSACSSFVVDLHVARGLLSAGLHRRLAIFNPERYSLRMDFTDKKSCVLFGDGCAAALLEADSQSPGLEIIDTHVVSEPAKYELVAIPDGKTFYQHGQAVQKFAITKTIEATETILARNQLTARDVAFFTGHQANLRMVTAAAERLGISQEKHLFNVDRFGNQGAAGAPSVLSANWSRFRPGDYIVVAVVGSGLTWGSALLRAVS